jgi:hypothetical protein
VNDVNVNYTGFQSINPAQRSCSKVCSENDQFSRDLSIFVSKEGKEADAGP